MTKRIPRSLAVVILGVLSMAVGSGTRADDPVEQGKVAWARDLPIALQQSARSGKPVLVLFQEIPGCQTCRDFGNGPLANPLVVEAIESEFIPVLVHNNRPGPDAELLERFDEPSWNNPVIRYLDAAGADLIPRKEGVWSTPATVDRMIAALHAAERPVPRYLSLLAADPKYSRPDTATFAMHCFWEGESRLGRIDGVVSTRSGWLSGQEVVTVKFLPGKVDYGKLVRAAKSMDCAGQVFAHDAAQLAVAKALVGEAAVMAPGGKELADAKPSDQKYYLQQSVARYLPMPESQSTFVNALMGSGGAWKSGLSPDQLEMLGRIASKIAVHPGVFDGLVPPDGPDDLFRYQQELSVRLMD